MVDASPVNVLRWKIVQKTFNRASALKCIDKIVPKGGLIKDLGENIDNIAESNRQGSSNGRYTTLKMRKW